MKRHLITIACLMVIPFFVLAQNDTTTRKPADAAIKSPSDTSIKPLADTAAKKVADTTAPTVAAAQNCYTKWYDFMKTRGAKAVTDGSQQVVVAMKNGESCHCFMGKIEVVGGKIKGPLYIQQENGDYKTSTEVGKKLDPAFVSSMGAEIWTITDGMSTVFRTTDQEYGRIFFYNFANKKVMGRKEAPTPEELVKD